MRNGFRYSLERRLDDQRALRERRAAPADEPRLGRLDLDDDQADAFGAVRIVLMSRILTGAVPVTACA